MSLVFAGCATESSLLIVSRTNHQVVKGTVDWLMQRASISLNGRNYEGNYILAPAPQTTVIVNNNEDEKKGGRHSTTTAPRNQYGTGKMLLLSNDGDTLRCEFSYEETIGMKAIGICTDVSRHEFDLQIDTPL
jgi:hypothetical protein